MFLGFHSALTAAETQRKSICHIERRKNPLSYLYRRPITIHETEPARSAERLPFYAHTQTHTHPHTHADPVCRNATQGGLQLQKHCPLLHHSKPRRVHLNAREPRASAGIIH